MAVKKIEESPKITDQILFQFETTNDAGLLSDPYKVNKVVIYHLERDFLKNSNLSVFEDQISEKDLINKLNNARQLALSDPTEENLSNYIKIQKEFDSNAQTKLFYYKNAQVIEIIGSENFPAWLESDLENSRLTQTDTGKFEFLWNPLGAREGDYFVCWEWEPEVAGTFLAKYIYFSLEGDTQLTTSIPTHFTKEGKYETLLERYTPDMFKQKLMQSDLTPEVIQEFNAAIAEGFTSIENLGNQLIDIKDANATHEAFLHILANHFGVRLRSTDATMWRRQIKRAIPLYKKKGTYEGLNEALDQAGVRLEKFTLLWQITSAYTWQEYFVVENGNLEFELNKVIIEPIDEDNFKLYFRYSADANWTEMTSGDASFSTIDSITTMTVSGLDNVDEIRIIYQYKEVPSDQEQNNENYIRFLPLADQRDPRNQIYPPVNWNIKVIEEDDSHFEALIPHRHPFHDDVIFGHIRTEFPYSENIYNMEEYNGSIRESTDPCNIDRDFVDECNSCQSSMFNIDVEISNLSNIRILETLEIVKDYVPFHALLHTMNFSGGMSDFIQPPVEDITCLIRYLNNDSIVMGQYTFNRSMIPRDKANREDLADMTAVISNLNGTLFNERIAFYSIEVNLDELGISNNNVLEILSPSGEYSIENASGNYADIIGVSDGFDASPFTFNLSNNILETTADIYQDNIFKFCHSEDVNFLLEYPIKTYWDIRNTTDYDGGAWKIQNTYGTFEIDSITPDNNLILRDPDDLLPSTDESDLEYSLLSDHDIEVLNGIGNLIVIKRGKVDLSPNDASIYEIGHYLVYDTNQYKITEHNPDNANELYIENYDDGDVGSASVKIYRRLIDRKQGQLVYDGWRLDAGIDLETALEIQNGENPPVVPLENGRFKQNYLILINSEYYIIKNINANIVTLSGPPQDWEINGTPDVFSVYRFDKKDLDISLRNIHPKVPGFKFTEIDRNGNDIIKKIIIDDITPLFIQNSLNNNGINETVNSKESINFKIEYKDGTTKQGEI